MFENRKVEQIEIPELAELVAELQNVSAWSRNPDIGLRLLEKIAAFFITLDTRGLVSKDNLTYVGKDLTRNFPMAIEILLAPLVDSGFLKISKISKAHPVLMIHHCEDEKVENLKSHLIIPNKVFETVIVNKPLIHAHFDTVDFVGKLGSNIPLKNKRTDILYGRGSNDMKGQVAMLIMLLYKLAYEGCTNFFIVLGSNEEFGINEDADIFKRLRTPVTFDIEPTGHHSGVFANKIGPTKALISRSIRLTEQSAFEISNEITEKYYASTGEKVLFVVKMEGSFVYICFAKTISSSNQTILLKIAQGIFKRRFGISEQKLNFKYLPPGDFESEISPKVLNQVSKSIKDTQLPAKEYPLLANHPSEFIPTNNGRFGKMVGGFATQISFADENRPNCFIASVAEIGPRHSDRESVSLTDLWNFMKFLENFLINFGSEG